MAKSQRTILNEARTKAFDKLVEIITANHTGMVYIVGDSELAIQVDTAPTGEPIYATISPTMKPYQGRRTSQKYIKAYDPITECEKFIEYAKEREEKAKKKEEEKQKKIVKRSEKK